MLEMTAETKSHVRSKKSVTLEKELESAVRQIQSRLIASTDGYWSASNVLNMLIAGGLVAAKRFDRSDWQRIKSAVERKKLDFDEKTIHDFAKEDLSDGVSALLHLLPTPGATILLRFAERIIQKYYKKIMRKNPKKMTLGQIINELEKSGKVKKSLLGYFHFINEKRIRTSHPYRRYNQEEGERILLNIMDLLEEIYSKK